MFRRARSGTRDCSHARCLPTPRTLPVITALTLASTSLSISTSIAADDMASLSDAPSMELARLRVLPTLLARWARGVLRCGGDE